jgi:hypothetical protein
LIIEEIVTLFAETRPCLIRKRGSGSHIETIATLTLLCATKGKIYTKGGKRKMAQMKELLWEKKKDVCMSVGNFSPNFREILKDFSKESYETNETLQGVVIANRFVKYT